MDVESTFRYIHFGAKACESVHAILAAASPRDAKAEEVSMPHAFPQAAKRVGDKPSFLARSAKRGGPEAILIT